MSQAEGALCVQGDMRLDMRLQRQKTRLRGALNAMPGNSGFQREDCSGSQVGGTQVSLLFVKYQCRPLEDIRRQSGSLHNVCNMCGSHSPLWLSGDWSSGTNKPGHRGTRGVGRLEFWR